MSERIWFVIAAAGASSRFGGSVPKPYLRIAGRSLLEYALRALARAPGLAGGVVVTTPVDRRFPRLPASVRRGVTTVGGGPTRSASVLNGLQALASAAPDDWVLVHDAARPCVPRADLSALVAECRRNAVGGLLAVRVTDTLKRADAEGRSIGTVPRDGLWRAQTPQMFRHGRLLRALQRAQAQGLDATDEAAAIEGLGLKPRLVEGSPLNVKVTRPSDLALAEAALRQLRVAR
ncbi:MAG TPA: 2-C-methyl-D-erythritol 4-phosphate cytidylyltransferase [Steroidobacteraceae bacterium]|nr:2-C-methyl-D-erythritol 4-phosphate cytidylyltransferase [Steroidobacteraceae bacterium]